MGFFDFMRAQPAETKESQAQWVHVVSPGQPVWTPRDYEHFAKEGYIENVVAYQAINKIAEAVASVTWEAFRGETKLTKAPILDLMTKPNPTQSGPELIEQFTAYLMIAGNGYLEGLTVGGETREIYALRPDKMKIVPGLRGMPIRYEYGDGAKKQCWDVDPDTGKSDIHHLKLFHPTNSWYGLAPTEPSAFSIDQHNEGMKWQQALLQNSARPSGALVVDAQKGDLSDDQFERVKAQVEAQYSGASNAGRPMLLEGGMKWQAMGLSPSDMGVIENNNAAARNICLAWGVPPQLLGIPGDNTYSNYRQARLAFWEDTVMPLLGKLGSFMSRHFTDGEIALRPNLEKIPAIVDQRETLWKMVKENENLTVNEKRETMGYEPVQGGDVLLVPMSQIPLDEAGMSAARGEEPTDIEEAKALALSAGYGDLYK